MTTKEVEVMGSKMVDYSGRGPTKACVCKPDIVAPGCGIISCCNEPGHYFIKIRYKHIHSPLYQAPLHCCWKNTHP